MTAIHIKAIDWAIAQGYTLSVTDVSADRGEWDVWRSHDRKAVIEACEATELPNVYIEKLDPDRNKYIRVAVFSVIDEGIPEETINDYISPDGGEFDRWMESAI